MVNADVAALTPFGPSWMLATSMGSNVVQIVVPALRDRNSPVNARLSSGKLMAGLLRLAAL